MTTFEAICESKGWGRPVPEYRFALPDRQWRFDWAFVLHMLALEVEGGAWKRGRHTRGKGFVEDMLKYNTAVLLGWRVLRCTPRQFESGSILALVECVIERSA